jgi:two-component system nitrate/nitrite response regulator NarL
VESGITWGAAVRILVVDDVRLHREQLVDSLRRESFIGHVAGAAGGAEAARLTAGGGFDVVLLSTATAEGLSICRRVIAGAEHVRVIALGVAGADDEAVVACAEAGVTGYLLRDQPFEDLLSTIAAAARGELTCPPAIAAALLRGMGLRGSGVRARADRMTHREREVLVLIEAGLSNKEIARKLNIEIRTVKNHVHNLMEKLDVRRRGEAAALMLSRQYAFEPGTRT